MSDKQSNNDLNWLIAHACLGFASYVSAKLVYKTANNTEKKIEKMQNKPVYRPNELLAKLKSKYYMPYQAGQLREIECGKYFLQGVVGYPSNQIFSLDDRKQLVSGKTDLYEIQMKIDEKKTVTQEKKLKDVEYANVNSFFLSEKEPAFEVPSNHVMIEDFDNTKKTQAWKDVATYDKINHDDFGKIYSLAAGTALTIGIQKNQFGIELGDQIITYGKAILDLEKMQIIFRSPKHFLRSKSKFIDSLESSNSVLKFIGLLLLSYSVFEAYKFFENLYFMAKKSITGNNSENK